MASSKKAIIDKAIESISDVEKTSEIISTNKLNNEKRINIVIKEEMSPMKKALIENINERKLSYDDLRDFFVLTKEVDRAQANKLVSNAINTLSSTSGILDMNFLMFCDFIDLEVMLVPREDQTSISYEARRVVDDLHKKGRLDIIEDILKEYKK